MMIGVLNREIFSGALISTNTGRLCGRVCSTTVPVQLFGIMQVGPVLDTYYDIYIEMTEIPDPLIFLATGAVPWYNCTVL